jgi:hydrogen peroxide-dependent heme synthase
MSAPTKLEPGTATHAEMPAVPLTLEGSAVLHQMFRFRRSDWRKVTPELKSGLVREAETALANMERQQSALYSLFGHKGDILLVHFRNSFDELKQAELEVSQLRLADFFEPAHSYLSVVELGLYDSSAKIYQQLAEHGVQPHSESWKAAIEEQLARQRETMRPRLWPEIPPNAYICFYPMDRKRGEHNNWYMLPIAERQRQMHEHGMVGRRYAGEVRQIITGSIGFDDWEWGVDLFADDPLVFKKLIYEMRFDQVSAVYALFGTFYVGVRCPAAKLGNLLEGVAPAPAGKQ